MRGINRSFLSNPPRSQISEPSPEKPVLRDVSRAPAVFAAQQRIHNLGIRILGAVMIGAKGEAGATAYAGSNG